LDKSDIYTDQRTAQPVNGNDSAINQSETIPGEVLAAIATALYEISEDIHDWESNVLTIKRTARNHSSWSSKIHGLRKPVGR
jgi:hypothetical protein